MNGTEVVYALSQDTIIRIVSVFMILVLAYFVIEKIYAKKHWISRFDYLVGYTIGELLADLKTLRDEGGKRSLRLFAAKHSFLMVKIDFVGDGSSMLKATFYNTASGMGPFPITEGYLDIYCNLESHLQSNRAEEVLLDVFQTQVNL